MNLYHLKYFTALAEIEHYTKTAQTLAITQPSLSYAISSLEDELGVKLFKKSGRNVVLTKYGKTFYHDVKAVLDCLDSSVKDLKYIGEGGGRLDIAFVRALGVNFVPTILRRFYSLYPNNNISINLFCDYSLSKDILQGIKDQTYDIAFCSKLDNEPQIEFFPIIQQDMVVIVPNNHPLAEKDSVRLQDILPYDFITFKEKSGLRRIIDNLFAEIHQHPNITCELAEDQVVAGFVAQGFGIAIVPYMHILKTLDITIIPLNEPSAERFFYMATLKDSYETPLITSFKKFITDTIATETLRQRV